jgi:hypothetical protein
VSLPYQLRGRNRHPKTIVLLTRNVGLPGWPDTNGFTTGQDAVQTIAANGIYLTTDTWSVTWNSNNSGLIQFGASQATVLAALEAITGIGSGNLSVTGNPGVTGLGAVAMSWAVEFIGALGQQVVNPFTGYLVTSGDSITITQTQIGHP